MPKKTLLLFTYYWPPASGPGVQRWLKFIKYLPEFGWNAIVVTPEFGSYPNTDSSLLKEFPSNVILETTKSLEPFRLFNLISGQRKKGKTSSVGMGDIRGSKSLIKAVAAFVRANMFIPDARKGWVPFATNKGENIIKSRSIDLIITTGPPHSSHLIGYKLKKKYNMPWIADFRDPWTNIYYNEYLPRSNWAQKKDLKLENKVLSSADATLVVSKGLKKEFQNRTKQIHTIPNGYDEEDFIGIDNLPKNQFFRLSYIGNLKTSQNCISLWEAIHELCLEDLSFKESFKLSLTGNIHEEIIDELKSFSLMKQTEILPFVKHQKAIERMCEASALLFPIPNSPNNEQIITGKIFEYLASKTPMVSIGPVFGDASEILRECKRVPMLDYSDKASIKKRLKYLFEEWKESQVPQKVDNNAHEQFSRKRLTEDLTKVFFEVISGDK